MAIDVLTLDSTIIDKINRNFTILSHFAEIDKPTEVTNALVGTQLTNALNSKYNAINEVTESNLVSFHVGMSGGEFISAINSNNQNQAAYLSADNPVVEVLFKNNLLGWYDLLDTYFITKNVSNVVSEVRDKCYNSNHKLTGSATWNADKGITFNGINEYLKTDTLSLSQPLSIFAVIRHITYNINGCFIGGKSGTVNDLHQGTDALPRINQTTSYGMPLKAWSVLRLVYNGANSRWQFNDDVNGSFGNLVFNTFDAGSGYFNGITIGCKETNGSNVNFSNIEIQSLIIVKEAVTVDEEIIISNYMRDTFISKYRFENGKLLFTWDGDYINDMIYPGHNLIHSYGIKDLVYLCTQGGGGTADMWDKLSLMYADGCEMNDHGIDHVPYTSLTAQQLRDSIALMDSNITSHGFPLPKHTVSPYAYNTLATQSVIAETKLTNRGTMDQEFVIYGKHINKYTIPSYFLGPGTNLNNPLEYKRITDAIDYAVQYKCVILIYCHGINETGHQTNYVSLDALCQHIVASGIELCSMAEIEPLLLNE